MFLMNNVTFRQHYSHHRKKIAALLILTIIINACDNKQTFRKRMWVKSWVGRQKEQGIHHNLFTELWLEDQDKFRRYILLHLCTFYIYLQFYIY